MKNISKRLLTWLIHPVSIGIYITFIIVKLTITFYASTGRHTEVGDEMSVVQILRLAHQKSIDYRLRARGPRPVAPNLALITVDDRALAAVGRWPWPRATIAKGVENAFQYGARLLAFDISFAEPSANPAIQVQKVLIEQQGQERTGQIEWLTQVADQLDNDKLLAKSFTDHTNKIVAGCFAANTRIVNWPPYTEFCRDIIFKRTSAAKQWDHEEILLSVIDPLQPYMPQGVYDFFTLVMGEKERQIREHYGESHNKSEKVIVDGKVQDALHDSCNTILDDFKEELNQVWAEVVLANENPNEFNFKTYDEWLEDYKAKTFPNALIYADNWALNTPKIAEGTKHSAFFNTEQDADGTIRHKALVMRTGNTYFPALSLKAYLVANDFNASPRLTYNPASGYKELEGLDITDNNTGDTVGKIPTDELGMLLLNYAGPDQMYPYLSFADLLTDSPTATIEQRVYNSKTNQWVKQQMKVDKTEFIKDKIFVVGATAIGIYDLRVTPFQENYPGAETHLNAIDNMMQKSFFRSVPNEAVYMPLALGAVGLTLTLALAYLGALWGMVLTVTSIISTILIDQHYLFNKGLVVTIIWPLLLISLIYITLTFYRYLTEERGKKELRQTFQKYVSPAIVEEILAHPKNIELGGKKVSLTVMFSDVRGFTTISEKLDPRALSDLLNSYLTPMTELVFKNRGTLDKYMGDAIMAFFGAPIQFPDHAKFACRCALQSLNKLFELQKEYERKGLPTIDIGIGLNTGEVSVGNMGSETVRSYTVMGDAVNLGSRLEGINKQYGTRIILSEFTYNDVKDSFICREVDWVRVKGKALPVKIYELISEEKVPSNSVAEMLKWFQEGYQNYHEKAWQRGLECFSKALDINPNDEVSKLYVQRCQDYINDPPDADWDGVFVMKTK